MLGIALGNALLSKTYRKQFQGNFWNNIAEGGACKLGKAHANQPLLVWGSQKCIKSTFPTFWSQLHSSVLDSFNRMTGFLLYFVWAIRCGRGIAHCFIAWKWNVRSDWCVLSSWLRMSGWHSLSLPRAFRSCLSLPGKTDSKQAAFPLYTTCDFLNLHVEVEYVTVNSYNRNLKNGSPGLLSHNSIRIIYFLVLEAWLKIVLLPEMTEIFHMDLPFFFP